MGRSHPHCWNGETYVHDDCRKPSGRDCIEPGCSRPAGTAWGPHWCPAHDVERLDGISDSLQSLLDK